MEKEAIFEPKPITRSNVIYSTWIAFFAWVFAVYDFILFGTLLPKIGEDLGWDTIEQAKIATYIAIGGAIVTFIIGPVVDKLGRKSGIIITVLLSSLCAFLTAFGGSLGKNIVIGIRSIAGLGYAEQGVNAVYLLEIYDSSKDEKLKKRKGFIYSLVQGGWPIGALLATGITAMLLPIVGWQGSFIFAAIPSLIIGILAFKLRESPQFEVLKKAQELKNSGNKENADILLKKYNLSTAEKPSFSAVFQGDSLRAVVVLCLAVLLNWFAIQTFAVLGTTVITQVHNITFENSLFILILSNLTAYLGYLFHGWLGDKFGRRNVLAIGWMLGGLSFLMMLYAPSSFWIVVMSYSLGLFFLIGPYSAAVFFISESFPVNIRATAGMLVTAMGPIGAIFAGLGATFTLSDGGTWLSAAFYYGAIPCFISGFIVLFAKSVKN